MPLSHEARRQRRIKLAHEEIAPRLENGWSMAAIARKLGIGGNQVARCLDDARVDRNRRQFVPRPEIRVEEEMIAEALKLYTESKLTIREIANRLPLGYSTIARAVSKAQVSRQRGDGPNPVRSRDAQGRFVKRRGASLGAPEVD